MKYLYCITSYFLNTFNAPCMWKYQKVFNGVRPSSTCVWHMSVWGPRGSSNRLFSQRAVYERTRQKLNPKWTHEGVRGSSSSPSYRGCSAYLVLACLGLFRFISSHRILFILPALHYSYGQPNRLIHHTQPWFSHSHSAPFSLRKCLGFDTVAFSLLFGN